MFRAARRWAAIQGVLLVILLAGALRTAAAADITLLAADELTATYLVKCNNAYIQVTCTKDTCESCACQTPTWTCDQGRGPGEFGLPSGGGSVIDNLSFNHHHIADDFRLVQNSACRSCGGADVSNELIGLYLQRRHRFRDMTQWSSFGPGVFSNYDTKLRLYESGAGNVAEMFDPYDFFPRRLVDGLDGDAKDGVFKDVLSASVNEVRLLGANDVLVTDLSQAVKAELKTLKGHLFRFEVVNLTMSKPTQTAGQVGSALHFDGTNDYVLLKNPANLAFTGQITMSAWVKPLATGGIKNIVAHGYAGGPNGEVFLRLNGNNYQAGSWDGLDHKATAAIPAGDIGTWVHLAGVYDGTTWRLYRNGVELAAASDATGAVTVNGNWAISARGTGTERFFNGDIDEVQIYSRGLSAAEVAALHGANTPAPDLVSRYTLDGGQAQDAVGANHGILGGVGTPVGRLTRIEDRNGYGVSLAYKTFTPAELEASPERQWQINTVTDAHGRQAAFSYRATQVSGRWVTSRIDLPNGQHADYAYTDKLSQVTLPDGTVSTFGYSVDANTGHTLVDYFDAAADGTHRKKTARLTSVLTGVPTNFGGLTIINQASMLVRYIANGAGEVTYLNVTPPAGVDNPNTVIVYEGSGKARKIHGGWDARYFKDGWTLGPTANGYLAFQGDLETTFAQIQNTDHDQLRKGAPVKVRNDQGRTFSYEYNAANYYTKQTFADGTFNAYQYNPFNQVTRERDRLGRVTKSSYDPRGNLLTKEVGILEVGGGDANQPEYALYKWEYYPAGHANQFLLSAAIDANTNRTEYVYNANQFVIEIREPNDNGGGNHVAQSFTYDAAGRLKTSADALGRTVTYDYDPRDRVIKVTYFDGSTEATTYGTGANANMVIQTKDRNGNTTTFAYDAQGWVTTQVTAANDPSVAVSRVCAYVPGTNLLANCTTSGETTGYSYDYRLRTLSTTVQPRVGTSLVTTNAYTNNELTSSTDAYGRKNYNVYRASDGALIRTVKGTVPADGVTTPATITRNLTPNAKYLVSDVILDVEGQATKTIDPRGIEHTTSYDSRGRAVETIEAFGTAEAAKTQTVYDSESNTLEVKHPRMFDPADSYGGNFFTEMTYTARNLLKTRTEAVGRAEQATVQYTYNLDGTQATTIDARTNTWTTLWSPCCANRQTATLDPTGAGTSQEHDFYGNLTHTQVLQGMTVFNETTTRFDARHRPTMQTVWLVDPPAVDPQNPPIAGENGVLAANGLTTRYTYDDDLDDGVGLDATFATHLAGLNLGADSDGSAVLVTNPEGERTLSIRDGLGRGVRTLQLDAAGAAMTRMTTTFDSVVNIAAYGDVLETSATDALTHTNRSRTDAVGRTIESVDAENQKTVSTFDANGNRLTVRDPNSTGMDCIYDARNRDISCTDTQGDPTSKTYDKHSNVTIATDAKIQNTVCVFDARNRRISCVDRISGLTQWTYDPNSNLLSLTDAETRVTSYDYDPRNLKTKEIYPDHLAGSSAGDPEYGIVEFLYDGARRLARKTDQLGDTCTFNYDRANRLSSRDYRLRANSPSGAIADSDTFTFDAASRMLSATSGRYANTVTLGYDDASRKTSESLTIGGQTYPVGRGFDAANRLTSLTYPDGSVVSRSYTARDQLQQVDYNANMTASFQYDPGRRETNRTFGNGLVTTRTYRPDNLTATIDTPGVTSFSYGFDANKNKTDETIGGVMAPYGFTTGATGYDSENRLTAWNRADSVLNQSWNLSLVGDWNSLSTNGTPESRSHNPVHELTAVAGSPLSYDPKGNLTQRTDGRTFNWDFDNRPASSTLGADTVTYAYDALGRRTAKGIGAAATVFVCAGAQEVAEYLLGSLPSVPLRQFIYGRYIDEPLLLETASVKHFYHASSIYSVVALTDSLGAVAERYTYDSYGTPTILLPNGTTVLAASAIGNPHLYTGRRLEAETGNYYYRNRYYSPTLGRFISRDPIAYHDSENLYQYVHDAPLSAVDPFGLETFEEPIPNNFYNYFAGSTGGQPDTTRTPWTARTPNAGWTSQTGGIGQEQSGSSGTAANCGGAACGQNAWINWPFILGWKRPDEMVGGANLSICTPQHWNNANTFTPTGCTEVPCNQITLEKTPCLKGKEDIELIVWTARWEVDEFNFKLDGTPMVGHGARCDYHVIGRECQTRYYWNSKRGAGNRFKISDPDKHWQELFWNNYTQYPNSIEKKRCFCCTKSQMRFSNSNAGKK